MAYNLLICDDDEVTLSLLREYLKGLEGLNILTASKPEEALDIILKQKVHILLLDIIMPEINGLELIGRIKKIDPLIHFIMMTAETTIGRVLEALGSGAMDFIIKPFENQADILNVVRSSINRWDRWQSILTRAVKKDQ